MVAKLVLHSVQLAVAPKVTATPTVKHSSIAPLRALEGLPLFVASEDVVMKRLTVSVQGAAQKELPKLSWLAKLSWDLSHLPDFEGVTLKFVGSHRSKSILAGSGHEILLRCRCIADIYLGR